LINFRYCEWKNLLSTGNVPTRVELNTHSSTLIIGKNGNGKSTILDALTFALFNKPFRSITKPQLVNSINGKNLLVTVEFESAGSIYRVIRGVKPNLFEIWKNDVLITQDAALKDYQTVLEQQILKMTYRTFCQVVILGSSSFVPFMQLSASNRREVIEDILDIRIFSTMNNLLKEKIQYTKQQIENVTTSIQIAKSTVDNQQNLINSMMTSKQTHIESIQSRIDKNQKDIYTTEKNLKDTEGQIEVLQLQIADARVVHETISHANSMVKTIIHSNSIMEKTLGFFDENDSCPSCSQNIPHEHKSSIRETLQNEYDLNLVEIDQLNQEIQRCNDRMFEVNKIASEVLAAKNGIYTYTSAIKTLKEQNSGLELDIKTTQKDHGNIDVERDKLKEFANVAIENIATKTILQEQRNIEDIASILLKDTGIKTAVIKEYLPTMNTLINKYLTAMDFFVQFTLDESFNESIKSRYRDDFTYASFSEGERSRIDLALLFSWREIARLKNSANTNLLLLDEVLDGHLDSEGTDYITKILLDLGDTVNVFVISHITDQIIDKFANVITIEKRHDFSVVK
jgi:DNA repair exonuclease SbcCD ATPase subunit